MLTRQIDAKEAQVRLQELLSQIASGVEWILTDGLNPCCSPYTHLFSRGRSARRSHLDQPRF